jgi:hypothetical protein
LQFLDYEEAVIDAYVTLTHLTNLRNCTLIFANHTIILQFLDYKEAVIDATTMRPPAHYKRVVRRDVDDDDDDSDGDVSDTGTKVVPASDAI